MTQRREPAKSLRARHRLSAMLLAFIICGGAFNARTEPPPFSPPATDALPDTPFGREVGLGRQIFTDPRRFAPRFAGNDLKCSNCHLDEGRKPGAAPLWAAWGLYPQYRAKNGHVNDFQERLAECFRYSLNGRQPPPGSPVLIALQSYAYFLARGAPTGVTLPGQGFGRLAAPPLAPDPSRGKAVFETRCIACHGVDGSGKKADDTVVIPPLWGARSYNWGAGMARLDNAAAFIRGNMPLGEERSLSDQQAWDVAAYIDSRPRPQDPRFTGDVATTRARFHDQAWDWYGLTLEGTVLGRTAPLHRTKVSRQRSN